MDLNTLSDEARQAVDSMLRDGQKIGAIKRVREETGAGLAEAKQAVDDYARAQGLPVGASGSGSGCAGVLLVAGVGLLAAALSAGCGGREVPPEEPQRHALRGEVVAVDLEKKALRVAHEEIPGWMDAMTMRFPVLDAEALGEITVGDQIEATVVVSPDNRYWLEGIEVVASAGAANETPPPEAAPEEHHGHAGVPSPDSTGEAPIPTPEEEAS